MPYSAQLSQYTHPQGWSDHGRSRSSSLPWEPVDPWRNPQTPDCCFPVHAAGSSAGRAHLPGARLGRCTSPAPSPPPRGRGSRQRGVPRPLTCGCPSAALLRLGACPGQERIARRKRQHMSHPRAPGSEEEIPEGRDEAPGRSPRVPRNARFPEAKGGPAALPCREGLSRLLRRGEGWELRAVCPQLLQGCSAQSEVPPRLPCTPTTACTCTSWCP